MYSTKLQNLKEIDNFYYMPVTKVRSRSVNCLNGPICPGEIEAVI